MTKMSSKVDLSNFNMPEPDPKAQEISLRLILSRDHLLSNYKDEPEVDEFIHPRQLPSDEYSDFWIIQNVFKIGQGTHDPSQVNEQLVLQRAQDMTQAGYDLADKLFAKKNPPVPDTRTDEEKAQATAQYKKMFGL